MPDRNPAHTGPADPEQTAQESEQAGIADEGAAYTNAIAREADQGGGKTDAATAAPRSRATAPTPGLPTLLRGGGAGCWPNPLESAASCSTQQRSAARAAARMPCAVMVAVSY